ncbi:hypothetical protein NECID01_1984 [Nematocida sp. AWRm77]|nr:hypothetical protein NECID01_1984 [Nematocida sp. AWRm77]
MVSFNKDKQAYKKVYNDTTMEIAPLTNRDEEKQKSSSTTDKVSTTSFKRSQYWLTKTNILIFVVYTILLVGLIILCVIYGKESSDPMIDKSRIMIEPILYPFRVLKYIVQWIGNFVLGRENTLSFPSFSSPSNTEVGETLLQAEN